MEARTLLVALVLELSLVALGGAAERCAQPGALRCEEGRHQSVCLERSRVWHRVSDCAASGGFCADGRCVGGDGRRAARETCTYPSGAKCSENCTALDICLTTNVWTSIPCGSGQLCDEITTSCQPMNEAKCKERVECPSTSLKIFLPDLTNSSRYYDCTEDGEGINHACPSGWFYNACSGECDYDEDPTHRYPDKCTNMNPGYSNHIFSSPGLYYVCLNAEAWWMQCPDNKGYFDPKYGKCIGQSDYTNTCTHTVY